MLCYRSPSRPGAITALPVMIWGWRSGGHCGRGWSTSMAVQGCDGQRNSYHWTSGWAGHSGMASTHWNICERRETINQCRWMGRVCRWRISHPLAAVRQGHQQLLGSESWAVWARRDSRVPGPQLSPWRHSESDTASCVRPGDSGFFS